MVFWLIFKKNNNKNKSWSGPKTNLERLAFLVERKTLVADPNKIRVDHDDNGKPEDGPVLDDVCLVKPVARRHNPERGRD